MRILMANPFVGGGKVQYVPGKVLSELGIPDKKTEDFVFFALHFLDSFHV